MLTRFWLAPVASAFLSAILHAGCSSMASSGSDPDGGINPNPDAANGCAAGQKLCGDVCVASDVAHGCGGAACDPCPSGTNGQTACVAGACGFQCNIGFGDCDGNVANGCEKDVTTDAANCGSCGLTCSGTCANSSCQLAPPGTGSDNSCLTIDANNVYWTTANASPGAVYSIAKTGGAVKTLITGQASPRGIAVDAANFYFTTIVAAGDVVKCPLAGCPSPLLAANKLASNQNVPYAIAIDSVNAYWTNRGGNQIMKCALAGCGGTPTVLASGQNAPTDIAIDSTYVYWTNIGNGTVYRVPIAGGTPSQVAMTGQAGARGLTVDATNVYFAQGQLGNVYQVPLAGGTLNPLATAQMNPAFITQNNGELFFSNNNNTGSILKMPTTGGVPIQRAINQARPLCVAVDATTIYWINTGGNSVQKTGR